MKRIFLLLLISIVILSITGCSSTLDGNVNPVSNVVTEEKSYMEENTIVKEQVGSYLLFKTSDENKYLEFLTNFDESKYEIVHISTFAHETSNSWNDDYYMVTYKVIAE